MAKKSTSGNTAPSAAANVATLPSRSEKNPFPIKAPAIPCVMGSKGFRSTRRSSGNLTIQLQLRATSSLQPHQSAAHALHAGQKKPKPVPQIPPLPKPKARRKSADQKTNSGDPRRRNPQIPRTREQTPHYSATHPTRIQRAPRPRRHPNIPPANDPAETKRRCQSPSLANVPAIRIP